MSHKFSVPVVGERASTVHFKPPVL